MVLLCCRCVPARCYVDVAVPLVPVICVAYVARCCVGALPVRCTVCDRCCVAVYQMIFTMLFARPIVPMLLRQVLRALPPLHPMIRSLRLLRLR